MSVKKKVGRPSSKPFLNAVDVGQLVARADSQAVEHLQALNLGYFCETLREVAEFARGGMAVEAFKLDESLRYLSSALYSSVLRPAPNAIAELDQSDLGDEIAVVLMAAHARREIDRGAALSTAQIAALASLTIRGVQRLIDVGEIKSLGGAKHAFSAAEAKRFLQARGVPGL